VTTRLAGLTGATLETAPAVCQSCVWWQSRGNREPEKRKWVERAEGEWGAWGTIYRDDAGRGAGPMPSGRPPQWPTRPRPNQPPPGISLRQPTRLSYVWVGGGEGQPGGNDTRLAVVQEIEVGGSHIGMGWNRDVLAAVTDRLAQPAGPWRSFAREQ